MVVFDQDFLQASACAIDDPAVDAEEAVPPTRAGTQDGRRESYQRAATAGIGLVSKHHDGITRNDRSMRKKRSVLS
jgi:hypothetical protein